MLYGCLLPVRDPAPAAEESMNCDFLQLPQQQIQAQVFRSFKKLFYFLLFLNYFKLFLIIIIIFLMCFCWFFSWRKNTFQILLLSIKIIKFFKAFIVSYLHWTSIPGLFQKCYQYKRFFGYKANKRLLKTEILKSIYFYLILVAFPCISWIPAIGTWGSRWDWKAHSKLRPKVSLYLFERFPVSSSRFWSAGEPAQCVISWTLVVPLNWKREENNNCVILGGFKAA